MRTHFCMLYCADKHKMACFVFIACRCCLCALFLLSAALCCLAHKADLEKKKQTTTKSRQGAQSKRCTRWRTCTCIMLRLCQQGVITLRWPASSVCSFLYQFTSVLLLSRQQHEGLHTNTHKLSTRQRTWRSDRRRRCETALATPPKSHRCLKLSWCCNVRNLSLNSLNLS